MRISRGQQTGSSTAELAEAVALFQHARELVDDVLALSESTRGHVVGYLATLGVSGEQPPPSLPHPSTLDRVPTDAAGDHRWVERVRSRLPDYTGGQTTGLVYDQDGTELTETSGREEVSGRARDLIVLNNRMCPGERNCEAAVTAILPQGATLVVWQPGQWY
ncbi:DddA-like double-stranded DNA deaminase toxin [Actinopolyspora mortivallis]|uniref:DddA-like double-stranded DNA deaminase toxin n=1 Tax=Actinopolyspora mortivallis TaxID=33906 RepID=UPI00037A6AC9|nr:DddA-like double-stranded DNA deaminase toxin [Actinopolyspora mortivallis]